jgi:hypothetical protein
VPAARVAAAGVGAWRQDRNCPQCAPGLPARTATAAAVPAERHAATPPAPPQQAIATRRAANRSAPVPAEKTAAPAILTAASAANRVVLSAATATAPRAIGRARAAALKARAKAIAHTATPAPQAKALARRVPADRTARAAAIVLHKVAVHDRKGTAAVGQRVATAAAIVRATAEPRPGLTTLT